MRKNIKVGVSMALTAIMVCAMSSFAFASDDVVTGSKDNITVTKSAQWVQVNGKSADSNGNPYAKITFKVDTTKASTTITNTVSKGGSTDVMLVLDDSISMKDKNKMTLAKQAAVDFTKELMNVSNQSVRVGLVTFNTRAYVNIDLNSDAQHVIDKINMVTAGGGTNIQEGIFYAENILKGSQAKNKMMIVLSDGYPNGHIKDQGSEVATGSNDAEKAINQAKMATEKVPGLKIVTIGYNTTTNTEKTLTNIATTGANGNKMFYKADVKTSDVVKDLASVFEQITETVTSYVIGNTLVDTIPAEFTVVDGSIKVNDSAVTGSLSDDKKTVTWTWGNNKLEQKVYEMSVITTLDKSKVSKEAFTNKSSVYTNGTTIDTSKDSTGSAIFGYGKEGVIKLTSPKLALDPSMLTATTDSTTEEKVTADDKNKSETVNTTDDKTTTTTTDTKDLDESPKTGDSMNTIVFVIMGASALALLTIGGIMMKKKRTR